MVNKTQMYIIIVNRINLDVIENRKIFLHAFIGYININVTETENWGRWMHAFHNGKIDIH